MFETKSKIRYNGSSKTSLRITIPKSIVETLKVEGGDTLSWVVSVVDDELKVCVKKAE